MVTGIGPGHNRLGGSLRREHELGTCPHRIEIGDLEGSRLALEALVDTGATYTVAPTAVLRVLGVSPERTCIFVLGDGRRIERQMAEARIRVDGESVTTLVVFGDEQVGSVLGAYSLEGLGLAADPVNRRVVPFEELLMPYRRWRAP